MYAAFRRKYWRTSKSFVWLYATNPMPYDSVLLSIREQMMRELVSGVILRNRWRHLIYTLGERKFEEKTSYRNKRTEFYCYLKIDERISLFWKAIQPRFIPPALNIANRNNLDFYETEQREKNIDNKKYDIPKLTVEINPLLCLQLLQLKILQSLYSAIKRKFLIKVKSFFRC